MSISNKTTFDKSDLQYSSFFYADHSGAFRNYSVLGQPAGHEVNTTHLEYFVPNSPWDTAMGRPTFGHNDSRNHSTGCFFINKDGWPIRAILSDVTGSENHALLAYDYPSRTYFEVNPYGYDRQSSSGTKTITIRDKTQQNISTRFNEYKRQWTNGPSNISSEFLNALNVLNHKDKSVYKDGARVRSIFNTYISLYNSYFNIWARTDFINYQYERNGFGPKQSNSNLALSYSNTIDLHLYALWNYSGKTKDSFISLMETLFHTDVDQSFPIIAWSTTSEAYNNVPSDNSFAIITWIYQRKAKMEYQSPTIPQMLDIFKNPNKYIRVANKYYSKFIREYIPTFASFNGAEAKTKVNTKYGNLSFTNNYNEGLVSYNNVKQTLKSINLYK